MRDLIATFGWAVQAVQSSGRVPPYAYTVGLTSYGRPEILVTGMAHKKATPYLNALAHHFQHDRWPRHGDEIAMPDGSLAEVVSMPHPDAHLDVAVALYGDVQALQVVRTDDRGHYPWERGYRAGRWPQPVLGPRAEVLR